MNANVPPKHDNFCHCVNKSTFTKSFQTSIMLTPCFHQTHLAYSAFNQPKKYNFCNLEKISVLLISLRKKLYPLHNVARAMRIELTSAFEHKVAKPV